jgi:mono/diheme cytochrome c family protein
MKIHISRQAALLATMTLCLSVTTLALDQIWARDATAQAADQPRGKATLPARPTGDEARGESLYNVSCVVCHGAGATGAIGPRLVGNPVVANEQAFEKIIAEGRHMMPPLKDALTAQQLADIRAWLISLR